MSSPCLSTEWAATLTPSILHSFLESASLRYRNKKSPNTTKCPTHKLPSNHQTLFRGPSIAYPESSNIGASTDMSQSCRTTLKGNRKTRQLFGPSPSQSGVEVIRTLRTIPVLFPELDTNEPPYKQGSPGSVSHPSRAKSISKDARDITSLGRSRLDAPVPTSTAINIS